MNAKRSLLAITSRVACAAALTLGAVLAASKPAQAQVRGGARVGVELEPWRRWQFELSERALWGYRVPDTGRYQTQLEAAYDVTSFLRLGAGYRIGFSEGYESVSVRQRVFLEARLDYRWRVLRVAYRLRGQNAIEQRPMYWDDDAYLRNRASVYLRPVSWLEFDANAELFSQLDSPAVAFRRVRFEAGAALRLRRVEVGFTYRYDTPIFQDGHPYHQLLGSLLFRWEAPRPHPNRERRRERERDRVRALEAGGAANPATTGAATTGAPEPAPVPAPAAPASAPLPAAPPLVAPAAPSAVTPSAAPGA